MILSLLIQKSEEVLFSRAWLEALVLALLIGTVIRFFWEPAALFSSGIRFSAKTLLEIAVCMLGASIKTAMIYDIGIFLFIGIFLVVVLSLIISYVVGRILGLPKKMAVLIACGNSICGNSAIAAVAPIIDAKSEDVASSIAFTAVLGIAVVLGLPSLGLLLALSSENYGTLAGLTVYAVPQVLAATATYDFTAMQMGTLVKLTRVLMLIPVVISLSLFNGIFSDNIKDPVKLPQNKVQKSIQYYWHSLFRLLPWFIIGFLFLVGINSLGAIPDSFTPIITNLSKNMTIIAMAALGLGVDVRNVLYAGIKTTGTVCFSLIILILLALLLIWLNGVL